MASMGSMEIKLAPELTQTRVCFCGVLHCIYHVREEMSCAFKHIQIDGDGLCTHRKLKQEE